MEFTKPLTNKALIQSPIPPIKQLITPTQNSKLLQMPIKNSTPLKQSNHIPQETTQTSLKDETYSSPDTMPTMRDIINSSRSQNLDIQLNKLGPFFRITARSLDTQKELGRAEGVVRFWFGDKILHLDSMRLTRETLGIVERSIFGIGLFIGAVAIRYGYECGCSKAELLAINDTDLYHSKLVRFYKRIGFEPVYEVTGSSLGDIAHMLVWGGVGTRMDADIEQLMIKWCSRFKPK